jgi:hypothetical protein
MGRILSDGKLMSVAIKAGGSFEPGVPTVLFDVAPLSGRQ